MLTLTADCPRCATKKTTFDALGNNYLRTETSSWVTHFEVPAVCRHCSRVTVHQLRLSEYDARDIFIVTGPWPKSGHLNDYFTVKGFVSIKDMASIQPPEHVPAHIAAVFCEGSTCHSLNCFNAAGAMFRLCLDMSTKTLLPPPETPEGPNRAQRTKLFDRLDWLFASGALPTALKELASCVREDGNDAAHDGTLAQADAEDLLEFSYILLERIFTEPARLEIARQRRDERRAGERNALPVARANG